jgi:hypothetical protein
MTNLWSPCFNYVFSSKSVFLRIPISGGTKGLSLHTRIKLTKTFGHGDDTGEFYRFFFTKNELHVNGTMNFAKLPDDDAKGKKTLSTREQWKKFSKWIDDTKVDLQFLFT